MGLLFIWSQVGYLQVVNEQCSSGLVFWDPLSYPNCSRRGVCHHATSVSLRGGWVCHPAVQAQCWCWVIPGCLSGLLRRYFWASAHTCLGCCLVWLCHPLLDCKYLIFAFISSSLLLQFHTPLGEGGWQNWCIQNVHGLSSFIHHKSACSLLH